MPQPASSFLSGRLFRLLKICGKCLSPPNAAQVSKKCSGGGGCCGRSSSIAVLFTTFVPLFRLAFLLPHSLLPSPVAFTIGCVTRECQDSLCIVGRLHWSVSHARMPGRSDVGKGDPLICFRAFRVPLKLMLIRRDDKITKKTSHFYSCPYKLFLCIPPSMSSGGVCAGVKNVTKAKWSKLSGVVAVG